MDPSIYRYTGYCIKKDGYFSKWEPILKTQLEEEKQYAIAEEFEIFNMIYEYPSPDITTEYKVGDLHADFDSEKELTKAQLDAFVFADKIHDLGVEPDQIQYGFSGLKGFYVIVPKELYQTSVVPSVQEAYKVMLRTLGTSLSTLDMSIYSRRRMWRCNNTLHLGSGLYKINLTYDQLKDLNIGDIKDLARNPQHVKVDRPSKPNTGFAELFKKALEIIRIENQQSTEAYKKWKERKLNVDIDSITLDGLPSRYRHLSGGASAGSGDSNSPNVGRNYNLCKLVGCLKTMGVTTQHIYELAREFNYRCSPPKKWDVVEKQVDWLLKGGK